MFENDFYEGLDQIFSILDSLDFKLNKIIEMMTVKKAKKPKEKKKK